MDRDALALELISQIYRAAAGELGWQDFVDELSEAYQGSLVYLSLGASGHHSSSFHYAAGSPEDFGASLSRSWIDLFPWKASHATAFFEGFDSAGHLFPDVAIEDLPFYRLWMAPRGLPPVWPICFREPTSRVYASGEIIVLRQEGTGASPEFSPQEIALGNLLVPHLRRSFEVHREIAGIEWNSLALQEVVERLRLGVILLDSERRLLQSNRSADRVLAGQGGLQLRERKLVGLKPGDDRKLQAAIGRAQENAGRRLFQYEVDEYFRFDRKPQGPNLELQVRPLLSGAPGSAARDAVVVVLVTSQAELSTFPLQVMRRRYSLTNAEAELVKLLLQGASLRHAAERRGVALSTARGQLKAIFSKTGTNRQSQLVQVVLAGIDTLWDAELEGGLEMAVRPLVEEAGQ